MLGGFVCNGVVLRVNSKLLEQIRLRCRRSAGYPSLER